MKRNLKVSIPFGKGDTFPAYHSKAHIGLLQGGAIIGSVPCDCHHLAAGGSLAVDDALDQRVLVLRGGSGQHSKVRPNLVQQFLTDLQMNSPSSPLLSPSSIMAHYGLILH